MTGEQKLVLNAEPSQQAARFKAAGVGDVRLWDLPYTTLQRRLALEPNAVFQRLWAYVPFMSSPGAPLYKGRIMQLKGRFFDEKEAIAYYQKARPRNQAVEDEMPVIAKESFEALSRQFKPNDRDLSPAETNMLKQEADLQARLVVSAIIQGKLAASYWLGLIQYDLGEYEAALDYFRVRTLQFGERGVFWATGAHYNIARTLEAGGQRQKAIHEYESNILLRNDSGNLIRARWLKELDGGVQKPDEKKAEEKKIEETKAEERKTKNRKADAAKE